MNSRLAPGVTGNIEILASENMLPMAQNVHRIIQEKYGDSRFSCSLAPTTVFPGGELYPNLGKVPLKNKDVYLFESLRHQDPNTALVRLYLTINALTLASVKSVTLVLPYISYFRQDRKDKPRVPISAKAIANLIQVHKKVERIITMDMHSDQGQGFFDIPVDNIFGALVHAEHFSNLLKDELDIVAPTAPDHGAGTRTRRFAKYIHPDLQCLIIDKRRNEEGVKLLHFIGDPMGKIVIIYDDEIASGETIINAGSKAMELKAKKVYLAATHGIFCAKNGVNAEEKLKASGFPVVILNTIPRPKEYLEENSSWLTMLQIDDLLAHTIYESSLVGGSISSIFGQP